MARGGIFAGSAEGGDAGAGQSALRSVGDDDLSGAGTRRFPSRTSRLSAKERMVLRELAHGHTTEEIGDLLHVSPHTVRTHIKNAMRKLEAKTRAHAVAMALSDGAIEFG